MSLRTPLAKVRGLGSAKEGVQHWWLQRVTALALIPLTLWFAASVLWGMGADHAAVVSWLAQPFNSVLMVITLLVLFYHAQLGLQVVLEDYVHPESVRMAVMLVMKFIIFLLGASAVFSVMRVAFGG